MKILYIALGGKGGSDKALIDILSILTKDYDIEPLVICGRKDLIPELERIGVKSLFYDFEWALCPPNTTLKDKILYVPRRLKACLRRRRDVYALKTIVKEFQPYIIHTNIGVVNLGYLLGKKMRIPHIWHIREYQILDHDMHYIGGLKIFRRVLRLNKFNIGITKDLYRYFRMENPSVQIYDGVRSFRPNSIAMLQKPRNYFLFAGFIYQGKGLDELLFAYKEYCDRGGANNLFILGTFNEYNSFHQWVKQYIEKNNLDGVKLLGFRDDVDELMSHSVAVIVPSRFEAFGRVACEGMFNKTLVIGKDTGGTKEQFDNVDEYVGDPISLRYSTEHELVDRMFESENMSIKRRSEIIELSFRLVNSLYTNEISAAHVYEYYTYVLNYDH